MPWAPRLEPLAHPWGEQILLQTSLLSANTSPRHSNSFIYIGP